MESLKSDTHAALRKPDYVLRTRIMRLWILLALHDHLPAHANPSR